MNIYQKGQWTIIAVQFACMLLSLAKIGTPFTSTFAIVAVVPVVVLGLISAGKN